ncbi:phage tail protein [Nocardioides halotolerans]|jgi:microcystin-dependent protein|uniref:phage tail protein n=1 Tax=Nocardioides halotolerans TaxID=433660 RepID=UPI0003F70BAA|nr:tail fiber protein [Nocardioides halotolerans]
MAEPFLGEIRLMSFNFAPKGWAACDGQILPINQNQALFSLLGTMYGGNGQTTFALPDLRGRVPIHQSDFHTMGERAGQEAHTLTVAELPQHTHVVHATTATGDTPVAPGNLLADSPSQLYGSPSGLTTLHPSTVGAVGGSQPHQNLQPYLTLNYCIAISAGIFPSPN